MQALWDAGWNHWPHRVIFCRGQPPELAFFSTRSWNQSVELAPLLGHRGAHWCWGTYLSAVLKMESEHWWRLRGGVHVRKSKTARYTVSVGKLAASEKPLSNSSWVGLSVRVFSVTCVYVLCVCVVCMCCMCVCVLRETEANWESRYTFSF